MVSMVASRNLENSSGSSERWAQSGCQAQGRKLLQNVNSKKSEDGPSRRFAMSLIRAKKGKVR